MERQDEYLLVWEWKSLMGNCQPGTLLGPEGSGKLNSMTRAEAQVGDQTGGPPSCWGRSAPTSLMPARILRTATVDAASINLRSSYYGHTVDGHQEPKKDGGRDPALERQPLIPLSEWGNPAGVMSSYRA